MRYHVIPHTVFFTNRGHSTPRISWQVVEVDAGINERAYPRKLVASCRDEGQARSIADHFNGTNKHAEYWKGVANNNRDSAISLRKLLDAAIGETNMWKAQAHLDRDLHTTGADILKDTLRERDRLRAQLFEAREQRDAEIMARRATSMGRESDPVPATDKVEYAPLESPAYQQLREQLIADVHRRLMNASRIISENISLERTRRT